MTTLIDGGSPSAVLDDVLDGGSPLSEVPDVVDGNGSGSEVTYPTTPPVLPREDSRVIWLESWDGSVVVPLNNDVDRILLPGATGLYLPPIDVVTATTPGVPGSWLQETNILEREVFLPLKFASERSHDDFIGKLDELRGLVTANWFDTQVGSTGAFRLVVQSVKGERVLDVVYRDGWDGSWGGGESGTRWEKFGLTLVAVNPFFHARQETSYTYMVDQGEVFLASTDANPWPRALSASTVIGNGMQMVVEGEVPAWINMSVTGPATLASVVFPGTNLAMTSTVASGSELRLVTDPRRRSARLDGAVAWSKVAFTSTFAPLRPGVNTVDVGLNSAGAGTSMTVSWLEQWVSAW